MHDARIGCRRRGDKRRALRLDGVEGLLAALMQDADEIDHVVGALGRMLDGFRVTQVCLDGVDLPDRAKRVEMAGKLRPPHRDEHPVATLGKRAHHIAAEKTRTAEHRDDLLGRGAHRADHEEPPPAVPAAARPGKKGAGGPRPATAQSKSGTGQKGPPPALVNDSAPVKSAWADRRGRPAGQAHRPKRFGPRIGRDDRTTSDHTHNARP